MHPAARAHEILLQLESCLKTTMTDWVARELVDPTCITTAMPGAQVAYDYCSQDGNEDGMAWVQLTGVQATIDEESSQGNTCVQMFTATYQIGVLRCVAAMYDPNVGLPDADDQLGVVLKQGNDMQLMFQTAHCCKPAEARLVVGDYTPAGPDGGCVGGILQVTAELHEAITH